MKFAARHLDIVGCLKHGSGFIDAPLDRNVVINNRPAAVLGDTCTCVPGGDPNQVAPVFEAPNKIMAGMADILVNGKPLAAHGHNTVHDLGGPAAPTGFVATCAWDVWVGGNTQVGDAEASRLACLALAQTRKTKTGIQSYNNCGPETTRLLVNGRKKPGDPGYVTEDEWLDEQIASGDAQVMFDNDEIALVRKETQDASEHLRVVNGQVDGVNPTPEQLAAVAQAEKELREAEGRARLRLLKKRPKLREHVGGSNQEERHRQLQGTPAEADLTAATMANGVDGVAHGKGVILPMRNTPVKEGTRNSDGSLANTAAGHIIVMTAVVVDENGKPVTVIYNDTFNACGSRLPADEFAAKIMDDGSQANITRRPVW